MRIYDPCKKGRYNRNKKFMKKEYKTFGKSRCLRLKSVDYTSINYPLHIIIGTYRKFPFFNNPNYSNFVVDELGKTLCIVAWCLMPDHLHLLFNSEGKEIDVLKIIKNIKGRTSVILRKKYNLEKVWQKSFYDRILRKEEMMEDVSLYILNNPVRKGIVKDWKGYPYSWSKYYEK